jgi:type II secretory pathway predicted ATPase ExeA
LAERVGLELNRKGLPPLHKLQRHLALQQKEPGSPFPVIVVDDAQYLEIESIRDLCAILAHPDEQKALASLILVGDDVLDRTLRLESNRAIASRMAATFRLGPLTQDEAKVFLAHRLEAAKAPKDLFAEDAIELLAVQSRGNRRELMNLGVMLCIEAHSREERCITAELVLTQAPMQ